MITHTNEQTHCKEDANQNSDALDCFWTGFLRSSRSNLQSLLDVLCYLGNLWYGIVPIALNVVNVSAQGFAHPFPTIIGIDRVHEAASTSMKSRNMCQACFLKSSCAELASQGMLKICWLSLFYQRLGLPRIEGSGYKRNVERSYPEAKIIL